MAPYSPYTISSHFVTNKTPDTSNSPTRALRVRAYAERATTAIKGEHLAGALLTAVLAVSMGWLMWSLSHAVEAYRVF
jgi:hypothetical protein